eukprot:scaffold39247_cov51-Prasinocladus_malaysianus.AAC.3
MSDGWPYIHTRGKNICQTRCPAAEYECRLGGAARVSYPPVVAGGPDACTIHYIRNDKFVIGLLGERHTLPCICQSMGTRNDVNGPLVAERSPLAILEILVWPSCAIV